MGGDMLELNKIYNMDCLEGMKEIPDKFFDLAIVDPPYGNGGSKWEEKARSRFGTGRFARYKIASANDNGVDKNGKKIAHWDIAPNEEYFAELFRVSKEQIIWGGNYFNEFLPSCRNFIIWRKLTISETFSMAMLEYAWTSIQGNSKMFECVPQGVGEKRFHPTQKPIALYTWLLNTYAKKGDKILDTHTGSASSIIACYKAGYEYMGFEIDKDYYNASIERLEAVKSQISIWEI
jgi:site-specific DNA-methyltransferase (adenine-specific)